MIASKHAIHLEDPHDYTIWLTSTPFYQYIECVLWSTLSYQLTQNVGRRERGALILRIQLAVRTFLQIFMCLASAFSLNERPHCSHLCKFRFSDLSLADEHAKKSNMSLKRRNTPSAIVYLVCWLHLFPRFFL